MRQNGYYKLSTYQDKNTGLYGIRWMYTWSGKWIYKQAEHVTRRQAVKAIDVQWDVEFNKQ